MEHISVSHEEARSRAATLRAGPGHVGYKRSILRTHPCVVFQGRAITPLVELVNLCGTSGIFYDVIGGPDAVKNEISARFEQYCLDFTRAMLPDGRIEGEVQYRRGGNNVHSPDVLVHRNDELSVIMECKATRMSYEARFGEPLAESARGNNEIVRGIFQIWRFTSHVRRGLVPGIKLADDARGMVITLDAWLSMAGGMIAEVLERARQMAVEREPEITGSDQIPVRFCMIDDLENALAGSTPASFFGAIRASADEEHRS